MELKNLEKGISCKFFILMFSPFFSTILSNFHEFGAILAEFGSFLRI